MIKNYFKTAWRSLWKHPKTTIINLLGLTIGMAASVLIAIWVQNEYSFDNYHRDKDNIYRIKAALKITPTETWLWESSPYILGDVAKKQIPQIEQIARLTTAWDGLLISNDGVKTKEEKCAYVDEQWFNMFHYDIVEGSVKGFNKNPFSMVLTESTAKKYFGKRSALGRILRVDTINYKVEAVMKDNPANSSFQFNILAANAARTSTPAAKKNDLSWGNYTYQTYVKLKPGTDLKKVGEQLTKIQKDAQKNTSATFGLIKLKDVHFESGLQNSSVVHGSEKMVGVFAVLAILLMTTACINYVNLTTARASLRAKEVSVRKIIGADRAHLFGQFMAESFIVTTMALAAAVIVIQLSMPAFNSITEKHFGQPLAASVTWLILSGALLLCTLLNGLYPALMLSSFQPLSVFRGKSVLNIKDVGLRKVLVVIQFSISVILIISTLVIYMQMQYLRNTDLGYNKSHIFVFSLPWKVLGGDEKKNASLLSALRNDLDQQSSIGKVAQASRDIVGMNGGNSGGYDWDGRDPKFEPSMNTISADEQFNSVIQFKLKEGHWFTADDKHNVILNETAVKTFGLHKPYIGQRFKNREDSGVVVGVVKDFHYGSFHDKIRPVLIDNHASNMSSFYIQTRPGSTEQAIKAAQKIWVKYVPEEPFVFSFTDEKYNSLYRDDQRISTLITLFAGIAILVSALGLLGLAAFAAQQRVKEIGIRKVLGASISSIVTLLSTDFVKMVIVASVLAFPVAWWAMDKWLQDFAYRINISWWVFAVGAVAALVVALITVGIEAIRSAVVNPVKSLRSE